MLVVNFLSIPSRNTPLTHFDTLIVLGTPSKPDGEPSPEQRERTLEAVREYKAGIAPHIIFSGAAAHNSYVEAESMAHLAIAQGVPAAAIVEEPRALTTIQNLVNSAQLMRQHNWANAEIVSSPSHLARAALIANAINLQQPDLSFDWHTHASRWPVEYTLPKELALYTRESWSSLKIRANGIPNQQLSPQP
nr:YdcF family protein [Granulicella sp. dw_53]